MGRELIYKDEARSVMLRYSPANTYAIDSIKPANVEIIGVGVWIEAPLFSYDYPTAWRCSNCNQLEVCPTKHCPTCGWRNKTKKYLEEVELV